jgi:hypothetical protein
MTPTDLIAGWFLEIDRRHWVAVRAALTDEVDTDYSSLFGGTPERIPADDLVARWRSLLPGFDATQHFLGPIAQTEETARDTDLVVELAVRAYHRLVGASDGGDLWLVAGWYRLTLIPAGTGWQIRGIVLETAYEEGNRALVELATARATHTDADHA